jgi:DNA-binding transcriptional MerR regulator
MSGNGKYTVIELADKLNVPRTTITDWLVRYNSLIGFKVQGKRRIYTDASAEVLMEIRELRDKGLSSFDIEEELMKRHPIHGEFSNGAKGKNIGENKKNTDDDKRLAGELVSRQGTTEMAEMLRNMLLEMTRRMDELERQGRANVSRAEKWNIVSFVTILILAAVSISSFFIIKNVTEEKESVEKDKQSYVFSAENLANELKSSKTEKKLLSEKIIELDGNKALLQGEFESIKNDLEKQKGEFETVLRNSITETEKTKNAEILAIRDKFAGERLKFMEGLEKAKNNKDEMMAIVAKLQAQGYEQSLIIKNLSEKNTAPPPQE